MALKARIKALADAPEAVRDLYTEDGDEFVLAVEGMVPKAKLDEFRENNLALRRDIDALKKQFEGIDPEEARKLAERAQKERDKKLIDAGKVDELVAERVAAMKAEGQRAIDALAKDKDALTRQLEGLVIDGAIRDAAGKSGVRATAVDDVLLRGRQTFRLVDGKAMAMDGDKPVYGKDGEPLGVAEWVGGLTTAAPHLFEASQGGGARGQSGQAPAGTVSRTDGKAYLANLDKIAAGAVPVA